ncbi:MAG: NADH:flavin oxidoreductase/NADH oxidase family protein [Porticoccaceae bacterium]|nr:NADH:flavin oxidoreductase/NADH oxidase family protein [Porticoccaceae bacterium]
MNYLNQPLQLPCGQTLVNRLAKASMTEGLGDNFNRATEGHVNLYRTWAEGGAGLLLSGNVLVDRRHLERGGNIAVDGNGGLDELRKMAAAGTSAGNHFWMQINHPGRQTPAFINPEPLAPSAVPLRAEIGCGNPRAMTEEQILDVIKRFVHVAKVAQDCGFTGVQVHAAHGYLMSQFLSPLANTRTDAWGGSLENRARALLEIVRGIRKTVGSNFPVSVKLNSADFQKGGFTSDESVQVVEWLGNEGIDLLEISGGNYEAQEMVGRNSDESEGVKPVKKQSTLLREAYFLDFAKRLRPVAKMPLMVTGGFRSKFSMEAALKDDELDIVGLARPLCFEPNICKALLSGEKDVAVSPELDMTIDRSALEGDMSEKEIQALETNAQVAWASMQILLMGEGKQPNPNITLLEAMKAIEESQEQLAANMQQL